jgi:hypothetical protein
MRRTIIALPVVALCLVGWSSTPAAAQDTKSARGTVSAMGADSVTVKVGEREMKFSIDAKTTVIASGGSTATRKAEATGTAGPKLADLVKVGDAVEISYHEMGATLHAASVRRVSSAGSGGGSTSDERAAAKLETANGSVESVTATSLVITGSQSGGTFKQTFTIDADTKVVGQGAGTAAAAKGGRVAVTDLIKAGDRVTVSYHKMGATLHAAEVRVGQRPK